MVMSRYESVDLYLYESPGVHRTYKVTGFTRIVDEESRTPKGLTEHLSRTVPEEMSEVNPLKRE